MFTWCILLLIRSGKSKNESKVCWLYTRGTRGIYQAARWRVHRQLSKSLSRPGKCVQLLDLHDELPSQEYRLVGAACDSCACLSLGIYASTKHNIRRGNRLAQKLESDTIEGVFYCFRRLDYFVISERLKDQLCDSVIRKDVLGSDHCPIVCFMRFWFIQRPRVGRQ